MIVVVLCGGLGTRMEDYSYPKPLNMIYGKPSISYALHDLPTSVDTIHFVVAPHLVKYNFAEIVINEFKTKKCIFHYLPYFTRGPIESAFLGTKNIDILNENIVFLDNDVLYKFPKTFFDEKKTPFIGEAIDRTNNTKYSYIKLDEDGYLTEFKEKVRISENFCCGVYGFQSIAQFRKYALQRLECITTSELYMSLLFQDMLKEQIRVKGIRFEGDIHHIGSLAELKKCWTILEKPKMRVCFDLDNTLVTPPSVSGDYSTVNPIEPMIQLARRMHEDGHTIIIHTARRMKTHSNNIGAVIKDIGRITFDMLEKFQIPYDEILFGKPIADMYIDDRSINPYRNDLFSLGYVHETAKDQPFNSLAPNKNNTLEVIDNKVVKKGPLQFISGEIYYYKNIPEDHILREYFPLYHSSTTENGVGSLEIEHIHGIPMFTLYKSELVSNEHIDKCFEFLDILHSFKSETAKPDISTVTANYIQKLKERFAIKKDYPFHNACSVQEKCILKLNNYFQKGTMEIVDYIHGDFWFSNMIIDFRGKLKVFDMRGKVYNTYTTGGDRMYDYAKFYQSILGYDCALNNVCLPGQADSLRLYFEEKVTRNKISLDDLKNVTFSLVMGTLHAIEAVETKQRVWDWICKNF
jgi:capsule biosynthesis phosphatase